MTQWIRGSNFLYLVVAFSYYNWYIISLWLLWSLTSWLFFGKVFIFSLLFLLFLKWAFDSLFRVSFCLSIWLSFWLFFRLSFLFVSWCFTFLFAIVWFYLLLNLIKLWLSRKKLSLVWLFIWLFIIRLCIEMILWFL